MKEALSISHEQENNIHELSRIFGGKCWAGPDIRTSASVLLEKNSNRLYEVPFIIPPESLPSLDNCSARSLLLFRKSTRSILGQFGVHIDTLQIKNGEQDFLLFKRGKPLEGIAYVQNFSQRPIYLTEHTRFFRFHSGPQITRRLEGASILHAFKEGHIHFDTLSLDEVHEGTNSFKWIYKPNTPRIIPNIIGIQAPIDPEHGYIAPSDERMPMPPEDVGFMEARPYIKKLLEPIPEDLDETILWIGQTPTLRLSDSVAAIVSRNPIHNLATDIRIDGQGENHLKSRHTSARFLHPGENTIVVEIQGPAKLAHRPTHVAIYFVPAV